MVRPHYIVINKIIKGPGTSSQFPESNLKHFRNVCHTTHYYLTKVHFDYTLGFKRNKRKCNFHYVASPMMMSQRFHKNSKLSRERNIFSSNKKNSLITHQGLLKLQKIVL